MNLEEIADKLNIHSTWIPILQPLINKPQLINLLREIQDKSRRGTIIYPRPNQVFRAFSVPFPMVKVVILGQDPYHTPGEANGLAFSSDISIPPSLKNIYKELELEGYIKKRDGNLNHWVKQGVLLLNNVLTVEKGKPNSHKDKGWEELTKEVIRVLDKNNTPKVFLLWGSQAKGKAYFITNPCHKVITCVHPSPLSANKGWWNNNCFTLTNIFLSQNNLQKIDW